MLIGLFAGGRWHTTVIYLMVAAACGFLVRQPITLVVKAYSGRRSRDVLPVAWFWIAVYAGVGLLHVTGLVLRGFGYLLYLAAPGVLIFGWYLLLLSRRAERRQELMEILATGAIALVAPAGMWAGSGTPQAIGWWLWLLVWAQSATGIVYVYLRLEQRVLKQTPALRERMRQGTAALSIASGSLGLAAGLGALGLVQRWLFVPFAVQWLEVLLGVCNPAVGQRPAKIGMRQLAVSVLFTILFIVLWRV